MSRITATRPGEIAFPLPESNRALWLCDERTGTIVLDKSGNGNHQEFAAGGNSPSWRPSGIGLLTGDDYAAAKPIITRSGLAAGQVVCSIAAPYGFIDGAGIKLSAETIAALRRAVCVLTGTGNGWGYFGDAGAGETTGGELIENGDMSSGVGWTLGSGIVIGSGVMTGTDVTNSVGAYSTGIIRKDELLKYSIHVNSYTGAGSSISSGSNGFGIPFTTTQAGQYVCVPNNLSSGYIGIVVRYSPHQSFEFDNYSVQKVLTPTTNGAKLYSSRSNNTLAINQNATFNPNAITALNIYPSSLNIVPTSRGLTIWAVIIPSGADEVGYIISKYDAALGYALRWNGDTDQLALYCDAAGSKLSSAVFTETDRAVFVAATISTGGVVNFWHNRSWAGSGTGVTISDNFAPAYLGTRFGSTAASSCFNGEICCGGILEATADQAGIDALYHYAKEVCASRGVSLP